MTLSTETTETNLKRKTLSLSEKTYNRLAKYGRWSESGDDLINRIKQTAEPKADLELEREIITPDSILKRFKYYNDFVSEIRKKNKEDTGSMPLSPNK